MWLNYFKIALRVISRNKLVSIINILGLALALSGGLLISIFVRDELSYDRFHENADRIYRVTRNFLSTDGGVDMHLGHLAPPFGPLLKNDFPDITESARAIGPIAKPMTFQKGAQSITFENENGYFVEPSVFRIFSIEILSGDTQATLEKPFTMMVSDKAAEKIFGTTEVVGKELYVYDHPFEITGTFKSFPNQSHWHPDVMFSFSTLYDKYFFGAEEMQNNWENNSFLTYILVNDEFNPEKTEQLFPAFIDRHMPAGNNSAKRSATTSLFLQPLTSIHLHSHLDSEAETNGNINHVYAMETIGLFLVFIACFNFINLSTARATERGKEVGLRKVSGALRTQLVIQYIGESTLITLLAMVVAVAMTSGCLPWLNEFTGKSIELNDYLNLRVAGILTIFVLLVGVTSGLYPAVMISGFRPAQILKGQYGSVRDGSGIRKALVVIQFSISIVMIISTLITYQQFDFLNSKDLGYAKDQVVTFTYPDEKNEHFEVFYNALTQHPAILQVARSNRYPTMRLLETNRVEAAGGTEKKNIVMKNVSVDQNFFATYNIPVISGTNFIKPVRSNASFEDNVANGFILNETAAQLLGWDPDDAVGKEITNGGIKSPVIGVVKDFHFESLHERIAPIVFMTYANFRQVSIRMTAAQMKKGLDHIDKAWKQIVIN